jgi:hypothetical protein
MLSVDWDIVVLVVFLIATTVGFLWRRTRIKALYYAWLAIVWIEIEARKKRDRSGDRRNL